MACNHEHCTEHHHSKEELEEKEEKRNYPVYSGSCHVFNHSYPHSSRRC